MRQFILFLVGLGSVFVLNAQCSETVSATGGNDFTIDISLNPVGVIIETCREPNGFQYELEIDYDITFSGSDATNLSAFSFTLSCDGGNIFQDIQLPRGGGSGTITTERNQNTNVGNCSGNSPSNLGCDAFNISLENSSVGISDQTIMNCTVNSMPIELAAFTVKRVGSKASLAWSTSTETNNELFIIQRSKDGIIWEEITQIPGAGTTTEPQSYDFVDIAPYNGSSYYLLKQIDFDGKSSYSDVVLLSIPEDDSFRLFPNPSTHSIRVEGLRIEGAQLEVRNMYGQNVKPQVSVTLFGESSANIDISNLPKGFYFINGQKFLKQ